MSDSDVTITCPHCSYAREIPVTRLPRNDVQATCPKCRQGFPLSLVMPSVPGPSHISSRCARATPDTPPAQPGPGPYRNPSPIESPVEEGGEKAKRLLLAFILLIVLLVGVRLWADSKTRTVPFPNFIATSAQGVAISWGQEVYLLDHGGKVVGRQTLPKDIVLTQLQFVGDELWIADYSAKTIQRLRNNRLEMVVNGAGRFHSTFKFAVDLQAGQIFVTDASNHKVHSYSIDGRYLDSFGVEGKGNGGLKFPNTIVFDGKGRLLIVNTNAHRLDIYERDGEFVEPFAEVTAMGTYRFPTLLAKVDERVAFFHTVDLREAKVVMYGPDGRYLGELVPPKPVAEAGDIAAWDGTVIVSDIKEKKIYRFSADSRAFLGPFSAELDALGAEAVRSESRYAALANGALAVLLLCSAPVFFLYARMRRQEQRTLASTDYSSVIPRGALLGCDTDRQKLLLAVLMLGLSFLCVVSLGAVARKAPFFALIFSLGNLAFFLAAFRLFMASGYANPARRETVEVLARVAHARLARLLAAGERVELCTSVQRSPYLKQPALLICTSRRILVFDYTARRLSGVSQLGYGNVTALTLKPVSQFSGALARVLCAVMLRLDLSLAGCAMDTAMQFCGHDRQILSRIVQLLREKSISGEKLGYAGLCATCDRPLDADGCGVCRGERKREWKPLLVSLIYPGVGQFYNRELASGTVLSALFSAGIIVLTKPVIKMVDRSAEFTSADVSLVAQDIVGLLLLYLVSVIDAELVRRKGHKLFSYATGSLLRVWLQRRLASMGARKSRLLLELIPGLAHVAAGNYRRALLLFIPLCYLLWIVAWSLLLMATGYAASYDYVIFEYSSAIAAMFWIAMIIDGLRQQCAAPPRLRITLKGCLITVGIPCITLFAGFAAQFLLEKAGASGGRQLPALSGTRRLVASYVASMAFGWGVAVMAIMGTTAWLDEENISSTVKASVAGLFGGIVCWVVTILVLRGVPGSAYLQPILFGMAIGCMVFLYFRNNGASPLIVPAVLAGSVLGNQVVIFSNSFLGSLLPALGGGATRMVMVALTAFFMHCVFLAVTQLHPQADGTGSDGKEG